MTDRDEVHFQGLPHLRTFRQFVSNQQAQEYGNIDIWDAVRQNGTQMTSRDIIQAVRKPEALKAKKTSNPLTKVKKRVQPMPQ